MDPLGEAIIRVTGHAQLLHEGALIGDLIVFNAPAHLGMRINPVKDRIVFLVVAVKPYLINAHVVGNWVVDTVAEKTRHADSMQIRSYDALYQRLGVSSEGSLDDAAERISGEGCSVDQLEVMYAEDSGLVKEYVPHDLMHVRGVILGLVNILLLPSVILLLHVLIKQIIM